MNDWQPMLRHVADVTPLEARETDAIRTAMLAEAAAPRPSAGARSHAGAVIGGVLAIAVAAGLVAARSIDPARVEIEPAAVSSAPDALQPAAASSQDLRHLQFATPGGTRIIWQFDPQFSLREQPIP
jgi:hypothetical protein